MINYGTDLPVSSYMAMTRGPVGTDGRAACPALSGAKSCLQSLCLLFPFVAARLSMWVCLQRHAPPPAWARDQLHASEKQEQGFLLWGGCWLPLQRLSLTPSTLHAPRCSSHVTSSRKLPLVPNCCRASAWNQGTFPRPPMLESPAGKTGPTR